MTPRTLRSRAWASAALVLPILFFAPRARAQCPNNNTVQAGGTITVPCPGTYSPAPCLRGGRYVSVNVTSGRTYTFSTCGGVLYDTYLTLYTSGGTLIGSNDDACGTQSAIVWTAPFTAVIRVLLDQGTMCNSTSTCTPLYISCANAAPANDLICNAVPLPVNANCVNLSPVPTNVLATSTAGPPAPGCANFTGGDVWFRLVVPAGGAVKITGNAIATSPFLDGGLAAYSSSDNTCTGVLTLLGCNDDINFPYNQMSELNLVGLTVGNTIFIRAWENGNDAFGPFNICATVTPPLPNEPCTSIGLTVATECNSSSFTNVGSTRTNPPGSPGCGFSNAIRDVWFSFIAPANGQVGIQTDEGTLTDGGMALYSTSNGTCSGTFNFIACDDDGGEGLMPYLYRTGLTPGARYWIRFWGYGGQTGTFKICVFNPVGTRPEDCIGGATVCDDQYVSNPTLFTGYFVDLSSGNFGCLSSAERQGTWYAFEVATAGNLGLTIQPLANDDYDFALWGPYASASMLSSICSPASPPLRCSYASGTSTFTATGSYNTGLANATYVAPQFSGASSCGSCTENSLGNGWVSGISVAVGEVYVMYISNFSQSGSAFNLTWDFYAGVTLSCTVLPVELLSLNASEIGNGVAVEWTTLSERNSDYFVVERSGDAEYFQPIGTVEAAGESQQRIDYTYSDLAPLVGANYYRLKQVDLDGAYEHTPSVVVFFGKDAPGPTVFPNPARDALNVAFDMPTKGTAYLQVLDVHGKVVRDRDMDFEKGPQTLSLRVQDLTPGTYDLRLMTTANGGPQNVRFIKE